MVLEESVEALASLKAYTDVMGISFLQAELLTT